MRAALEADARHQETARQKREAAALAAQRTATPPTAAVPERAFVVPAVRDDAPAEESEDPPVTPVGVASVEATDDYDSVDAMESSDPPSIGTILGGTGDPTRLPDHTPEPSGAPVFNLVPDPVVVADPGEVDDPASVSEPVVVAYEENAADDMSSEDMSLGLGRVDAPIGDGPSLGPISAIAEDPTGADTWSDAGGADALSDPAMEVTEVVGEQSGATPSARDRPRPLKWFPSELAAMAIIGVLIVIAIGFLVWRFG
jgi:hypothetical protein